MNAGTREGAATQAIGSGTVAPPHSRTLHDLVRDLPEAELRGSADVLVSSVCYRSDDARPGALFFCVPGSTSDGHAFAGDAVSRGSMGLVVDRWLELDVSQVKVPDVREAMGPISAAFYGRPADGMTVVGVTGTNGKTTTTFLLEAIFRADGRTPGVIGTTGVRIDGRPGPFPRTTPEAPDLQRLMATMADEGVTAVAMEVSSHGLHQHRVDGIRYSVAVFTNLTQDHLDYHPSMEEYFLAKSRLFTPAMSDRAVVNLDDERGRDLAGSGLPTITYGLAPGVGRASHGRRVDGRGDRLPRRRGPDPLGAARVVQRRERPGRVRHRAIARDRGRRRGRRDLVGPRRPRTRGDGRGGAGVPRVGRLRAHARQRGERVARGPDRSRTAG